MASALSTEGACSSWKQAYLSEFDIYLSRFEQISCLDFKIYFSKF